MTTYTYDRLAALRPANANEADFYTVPSNNELINGTMWIANQDASDRTYSIAIADAGNPAGSEDWIKYQHDIEANLSHRIERITLGAGKVIIVQASAGNVISFVLMGMLKDSS